MLHGVSRQMLEEILVSIGRGIEISPLFSPSRCLLQQPSSLRGLVRAGKQANRHAKAALRPADQPETLEFPQGTAGNFASP